MIKAYLHESGIINSSKHCLVGGYLGAKQKWASFEKRWSNILDDHGLVAFHAKDFFDRRDKPYVDWTDDKYELFLWDLVTIIKSSGLLLFGAVVAKTDFASLARGERRICTGTRFHPPTGHIGLPGAPDRPYFAGFELCMLLSLRLSENHNGMKTSFVFDRLNHNAPWAHAVYSDIVRLSSELGSRLGPLTFANKQECVGLQAADLACHVWHRQVEHAPLSKHFKMVLGRLQQEGHLRGFRLINQESLDQLFAGFPKILKNRWKSA